MASSVSLNEINVLLATPKEHTAMTADALTDTLASPSHAPTYPAHWRMARLGGLGDIIGGSTPSTKVSAYWNGHIPWLTPNEVTRAAGLKIADTERHITEQGLANCSATMLPAGTVMMTSRATIGEVAINIVPMATNQGFINIICDSATIFNEFLAYWLMLHKSTLISRASGSTFLEISKSSFKSIPLPLPPLAEQRAIARILRAAQDAIAARRRQVTLERERKAALMQRLFTHGVRGEPTKQTEIGEMPQSWQVVRLGAVSRLFSGGTPSKERTDWWNGSIPWASPKDLKQPRLRDVQDHVTEEAVLAGSRIVPAGTVFIVVRGMILAKDVPVALTAVPMAFNQDMKALIPVETLTGEYLLYVLQFKREDMFRLIGTSAHGTRRMGTDALERFLIPIPSTEEQEAIATVLHACETIIAALEREIALHEELFRALLEELMSGRLSALLVEETASGKA